MENRISRSLSKPGWVEALGMKHHRDVNRYLNDLDNEQIVQVGLALGLNYAKLKRMRMLPADMVAAWLRKEDDVIEVGEPTWKVLCKALKDIGQTGLAVIVQQECQNGEVTAQQLDEPETFMSPGDTHTAECRQVDIPAQQLDEPLSPMSPETSCSAESCQDDVNVNAQLVDDPRPTEIQESMNARKTPQDAVSMKDLTLIKWKDSQGKLHRLRIIQSICDKWRIVGNLLEISDSVLESILSQYRGDLVECCYAVMRQWLDNKARGYPLTWEGLIELLDDAECAQVAEEVKHALQ